MTKSFLLSAAIHVLILGVLFLSVSLNSVDVDYAEKVMIRIRNQGITGHSDGRTRAVSPAESSRYIRISASIPRAPVSEKMTETAQSSLNLPNRNILRKGAEMPAIRSYEAPQPSVREVIGTEVLDAVDPLAGFDEILPGSNQDNGDASNPWMVSWKNGSGRGILAYPKITPGDFPEETERLLDVVVKITVSPQGNVIAAEVVSPGSGDIRIDRRIHNAALQLVLEPWPEEKGEQEGILRLKFQEGRQ